MKRRATGLLALAAAIFVAARYFEPRYAWLGYVRATAEASVVGGLADWFAVTALFRHPLGIPIPHTAIIGRQKDRIGRIIGNFVQHHFLAREAVSAKLRGMGIAHRAAQWLAEPENAQRIAVQLASGVAKTLEALPDAKIRELIQQGAKDRIHATRVAPVLGKTLALVVAGDRHQELLDQAIRLAAQAVEANRELIRTRIKESSPWWVPGVVDEKIYHRILAAIEKLLHDVSHDPGHPLRASFDQKLRELVDRLQHSPEAGARAEALKDEWLSEGIAMYFETPDLASSKGWRNIGTVNQVRLSGFRNYLPRRPADSLITLLAGNDRLRDPKLGGDAYAEAWALNYFLIKQRPKQYLEYIKALAEKQALLSDDPQAKIEEFKQAFGNDLQQLDSEFLRYLSKIR